MPMRYVVSRQKTLLQKIDGPCLRATCKCTREIHSRHHVDRCFAIAITSGTQKRPELSSGAPPFVSTAREISLRLHHRIVGAHHGSRGGMRGTSICEDALDARAASFDNSGRRATPSPSFYLGIVLCRCSFSEMLDHFVKHAVR